MALTKRVEILFDPEEYRMVAEIARARGVTLGALVRRAVEQIYLKPGLLQRQSAVEGMLTEQSEVTWEEARNLLERKVGRRLEAC